MKTMTSVALFGFLLWGCTQSTESDFFSDLEASETSDSVRYTLTINNTIFQLADSLKIKFEVKNLSLSTKEYFFRNVQQFGFKLIDESENIAFFHPRIVSPAHSHFVLQTGQSKIFSFSYPFKDQNGNFIRCGEYFLMAYLTEGNSPEVGLRISIK